ncbi:MAG: PstS family phosphate ABC transporter substrate-binding protein [Leptolyngbyaceae cyanobacterium MO_188.B28]|nr:PstS family phosphate ABC transporter substrate-binding protein [Leptolyngbyaceae cyanobacterium MO_188.B28]
MPEEKGTLFTTVLVLIAFSFLGALFGGISLLLRPPAPKAGKPAHSASQASRRPQPISLEIAPVGAVEATQVVSTEPIQIEPIKAEQLEPTETETSASASGEDVTIDVTINGPPKGLFTYGGSTSWAPLRRKEAHALHDEWPDFQLQYIEPLAEPPGSGAGISMLLVGQLAFSQSSRPIKTAEYEEAQRRGFRLEQIPVAIDGIAFVINPALDIPGLTLDQLKGIYTGKITNWRELNGPNVPIIPFSRPPEAAGTPEFFVDNVLGNETLGNTVRLIDHTTQGLRAVAANLGGIFYASSPEVVPQCSTKPLPIARNSNEAFIPPYQAPLVSPAACPAQRNQLNMKAFRSGDYPLTRRLFVIVKKDGSLNQQAGEAYARLILTSEGQQIVRQAGFVNIR